VPQMTALAREVPLSSCNLLFILHFNRNTRLLCTLTLKK
jgi:hypothetical protein